ncbi:MAG: sigma-54-dependent transcriptional regulator [Planctomycetota bacterium]|jgi:DNA-binding NtrC family response regulator
MDFMGTRRGPRERILVIDDERLIRMTLGEELRERGFEVFEAETGRQGLAQAMRDNPDVILLDYRLPDLDGLEVLTRLREKGCKVPIVLMTAYSTIETAVKAIQLGAFDYLNKPFEIEALMIRVDKALHTRRLEAKVEVLAENERRERGLPAVVGDSAPIRELKAKIERVAESPATTVLIRGESGTGKDLLARALHVESSRAGRPFVNITCTAIPDHLLESELFGHEKGAFTDARTQKRGLFEQAQGGTVFLDEIGDMSLGLQAKLLRFLEDRTLRRVGGVEDRTVDVRVVAATHRLLEDSVDKGSFRADLYFRLKVIELFVPALRERLGDVRALVEHFVKSFSTRLKRPAPAIEPAAWEALEAYSWPGNVRELRNAVERALILMDGEQIRTKDLPPEITGRTRQTASPLRLSTGGPQSGQAPAVPAPAGPETVPVGPLELPAGGISLRALEEDLVRQALARTGGNQSQAARLLDLSRDQLRYRMERMGLLPPSGKKARQRAARGGTA